MSGLNHLPAKETHRLTGAEGSNPSASAIKREVNHEEEDEEKALLHDGEERTAHADRSDVFQRR